MQFRGIGRDQGEQIYLYIFRGKRNNLQSESSFALIILISSALPLIIEDIERIYAKVKCHKI